MRRVLGLVAVLVLVGTVGASALPQATNATSSRSCRSSATRRRHGGRPGVPRAEAVADVPVAVRLRVRRQPARADQYRDQVEVTTLGKSAAGHPIYDILLTNETIPRARQAPPARHVVDPRQRARRPRGCRPRHRGHGRPRAARRARTGSSQTLDAVRRPLRVPQPRRLGQRRHHRPRQRRRQLHARRTTAARPATSTATSRWSASCAPPTARWTSPRARRSTRCCSATPTPRDADDPDYRGWYLGTDNHGQGVEAGRRVRSADRRPVRLREVRAPRALRRRHQRRDGRVRRAVDSRGS